MCEFLSKFGANTRLCLCHSFHLNSTWNCHVDSLTSPRREEGSWGGGGRGWGGTKERYKRKGEGRGGGEKQRSMYYEKLKIKKYVINIYEHGKKLYIRYICKY